MKLNSCEFAHSMTINRRSARNAYCQNIYCCSLFTLVCSSTTRTQSAVTSSCIRFFFAVPSWKESNETIKLINTMIWLSYLSAAWPRTPIRRWSETINSQRASAEEDPVSVLIKSVRNLKKRPINLPLSSFEKLRRKLVSLLIQ